jgi:hypothetical protein
MKGLRLAVGKAVQEMKNMIFGDIKRNLAFRCLKMLRRLPSRLFSLPAQRGFLGGGSYQF